MVDARNLQSGDVYAGDYRVIAPLAAGGMGAIYQVEQLSTGKQRALKLMQPQLVADEKMRQRFLQEARVGGRIESEHLVEVIAAGVDATSSTPWLVMELLTGETLGRRLERAGRLSFEETSRVMSELCHAVGAAHAAGIVHRDLKPENLFLAVPKREGAPFVVKVLDFGIAKLVAEADVAATGAIGTPLWMSPEQAKAGTEIRPASDVWAIGLLAFWMLTGELYWKSARTASPSPMQVLFEAVNEPLEAATVRARSFGVDRYLPEGFDAWFAKCVTRDIWARFPTAREARVAFEKLGKPEVPVSSMRASSVHRMLDETMPAVSPAASTGPSADSGKARAVPRELEITLDRRGTDRREPPPSRDIPLDLEGQSSHLPSLEPGVLMHNASSHITASHRQPARHYPVERPQSSGLSVKAIVLIAVLVLAALFLAQKVFITGF